MPGPTPTDPDPPAFVFPERDELRRWRGVYCVPGAIPDVLPHGGRIWTPAFGTYAPDVQDRILWWLRDSGYKQIELLYRGLSYKNHYDALAPDPARFARDLERAWRGGTYPVACVTTEQVSFEENVRALRELVAPDSPARPWLKIIMLGYEHNGYLSEDQTYELVDIIDQAGLGALVYFHFTPKHAAPGANEKESWRRYIDPDTGRRKVAGILYQDDRWGEPDYPRLIQERLLDFTVRFGCGHNEWPTGFDTVAFELGTSKTYRDEMPFSWAVMLGAAALETPHGLVHYEGHDYDVPPINGFGDGGPV